MTPLILITNDDGYQAKGLRKLIALMRQLGDVVVITTQYPQSARSHAITMTAPLRVRTNVTEPGYKEYICDGTPVDCVKLGWQNILERRPDLVVSGINHGSNASVNTLYSATIGAAMEACLDGFNAIGFSLDSYDKDADFDHLDEYILTITKDVLANGLPSGICLNVNFPKRCEQPIQGVKICRQSFGTWEEHYQIVDDGPDGRVYQLCAGEYLNTDQGEDTDFYALQHNYVSVVPIHSDWTATQHTERFRRYEQIMVKK